MVPVPTSTPGAASVSVPGLSTPLIICFLHRSVSLPAIHATLDAYGEMIGVFVFHSGQEEDPEDRRLQSEYLADLMGSTSRPSILLSYLVTKTDRVTTTPHVSERSGMRHWILKDDWDRWCEYILYKGLRRSGYARKSPEAPSLTLNFR